MGITGSEIGLKSFPRPNVGRAVVVVAVLVASLGVGIVIGRVSAPRSVPASTSAAVSGSVISPTWLAATDALRLRVMRKMNQIVPEGSAFIGTAALPLEVMQHMNELASGSS